MAFTSDAKARWAKNWLSWNKYRQFWSQTAQWALRRLENADFTTEIAVDKGEGHVTVEALDDKGEYRNFLSLQSVVVSPKGERETIRLEQTGPGRYEAHFPTKEVGSYLLNLMELKDGKIRSSQVAGASVNYSPEFSATEPNVNLLKRLADLTGGKLLDPMNLADNPFLHDRRRTFQPRDLWEWLLKLAVILFVLDVGIRRIQVDRDEWLKATATLRRGLLFWRPVPRRVEADESLDALLARRDQVRARQTAPAEPNPELFRPQTQAVLPRHDEGLALVVPTVKPGESQQSAPARTPDQPASTTSHLLEAKRRARKKLD